MSVNNEINKNQFITLTSLKSDLDITDEQDDNILLRIVKESNNEVTKELKTVVDSITSIEGTVFFSKGRDTALTFAISRIRRDLNQMYDEAATIMKDYKSQIETLKGDVRAIAPVRTSRQLIVRDVPAEDDYFAERHIP